MNVLYDEDELRAAAIEDVDGVARAKLVDIVEDARRGRGGDMTGEDGVAGLAGRNAELVPRDVVEANRHTHGAVVGQAGKLNVCVDAERRDGELVGCYPFRGARRGRRRGRRWSIGMSNRRYEDGKEREQGGDQ